MKKMLLRRQIRRWEQKAIRAEAEGETLEAIKSRRAMYNAQVELWKLTTEAA